MAKKQPFADHSQEVRDVYDLVKDMDFIREADGRSSHILYEATVLNLTKLIKRLNKTYGKPTENNPLLDDITWQIRDDFRICIPKACSMTMGGTYHQLMIVNW